jgi:hypothetical protein
MMKRTLLLLTVTALVSGCTGKMENQLEKLAADQQALSSRLEALEESNRQLQASRTAPNTGSVLMPETAQIDTNSAAAIAALSPAVVDAMADQIKLRLQEQIGATIEERITSRIGSQEDIEAIFADVVDEELDDREELERLEREQKRRQQIAERDNREIARKAEAAGLDEKQQAAITLAMQTMREQLHGQLPELEERGASLEEKLAVVAKARELLDAELFETLSEKEFLAYYEADSWYGRQQSQVKEIATSAGLDETQRVLVDDAYAIMRTTLRDGSILMSEGAASHGDIRQTFRTTRESFTETLKTIMTPVQFETYEASNSSSRRRRGFGGGTR